MQKNLFIQFSMDSSSYITEDQVKDLCFLISLILSGMSHLNLHAEIDERERLLNRNVNTHCSFVALSSCRDPCRLTTVHRMYTEHISNYNIGYHGF